MVKKLRSLLRILRFYFLYKAKPRYLNPYFWLRIFYRYYDEYRFSKLNNGEIYRLTQKLVETSGSTGCSYSDYLNLYSLIKKHKPKDPIEFGSGISSCVIAYALKEIDHSGGEKGYLTTMEESDFYYKDFLKIIPEDLSNYINPILSSRKTKFFDGYFGCFYQSIPEGKYDFVYIDGPHTTFEDEEKAFDADILNLIQSDSLKSNSTIVLDQRVQTLEVLNKISNFIFLKYRPSKSHSVGKFIKE